MNTACQRVIVLTPLRGQGLQQVLKAFPAGCTVIPVADLEALDALRPSGQDMLVAFGTGVIVPQSIVGTVWRAFNFHAASPAYPGRDPHHFAVHEGAREYGATAHELTPKVDEGPIIGVEMFSVPADIKPRALLILANEAALRLLARLAAALLAEFPPAPLPGIRWTGRKTTRRDFKAMCQISPVIAEDEFRRRFNSFDGEEYDNLTTKLHGWTFRIDKSLGQETADSRWNGFTEDEYVAILRSAIGSGYAFGSFDARPDIPHVLWRHDVDLSPQRALHLARAEADLGVKATYFINPHSTFYNFLEPGVLAVFKEIVALGHRVGVHFDASAGMNDLGSLAALEAALAQERKLLSDWLACEVRAFSYHNPDVADLLAFEQDEIAGMINAYGATLRREYAYVSDSNGYWRFRSISEVLREGHPKVHVLTHPGWWTPNAMAPRDRIQRCALGRARRVLEEYDAFLQGEGRLNLDR